MTNWMKKGHWRILGKLAVLLLVTSACGEPDEPRLDQALEIASKASLECGLPEQLHDELWEAYASLPVTLATQPSLSETRIRNKTTLSFDSDSFHYQSPYIQFNFSVATGTTADIPYALSTIQFTAVYQDRNCKENCVVSATYGNVWRSDKSSVQGTPLAFSCTQPQLPRAIQYEWRAIPIGSDVPGELVAGFRVLINANHLGRTATLDINPRGTDRFCVEGDCKSLDISASDLTSLYSRRQNPTTYMPQRFFEDHPEFPSDPQLW